MVKVACDLVREGRVSQSEAIRRCEPKRFAELLPPTVDPKTSAPTIARGLPASPGAATGPVVLPHKMPSIAATQRHWLHPGAWRNIDG